MRFGAWTSLTLISVPLSSVCLSISRLSGVGGRARGGGAPRRQAARPPGPATRETRARTVGIANRDAISASAPPSAQPPRSRRGGRRERGPPRPQTAAGRVLVFSISLTFKQFMTPTSPLALHKKLDITNDRSTLPPPLFSALRQLGSQVDGGSRAASAATPTRLAARAKAAPCPRAAGGLAPLLLVRWTYPLAQVGGPACLFAVFARELPAQVAAAAPAATCLRTARGRRHGLNHVRWLSRRGGAAAEAGGACCDSGI